MVVGSGYNVETGPGQLLGDSGICPHVGSPALMHWIGFVIVKQHLQVGESHICRANELDHLEE